jgi:hypothetical protein
VPLFEDSGIELINVFQGDVAWGDYDNDGDLDILLTNFDNSQFYLTKIYRNDGNNVFVDIDAAIEAVQDGSVGWGDYDNDGDLDILLTNHYQGSITKVYRNDGNDVFTDINAGLIGGWIFSPVARWGDYDNDGDLDIFMSNYEGPNNGVTKIFRNDDGGVFTDILTASFQGVWAQAMEWGDYDNDGDLDILLTGQLSGSLISKVYRNDGHGVFTDINAALQFVHLSSVAWGDYDNDGDLDIILAGFTDLQSEVTIIYRNDGNNVFTDIQAGLTNVAQHPATAWGDYDNDGDLDILLRGCADWDNSEGACRLSVTQIYRNDGNGVLTNINESLPNIWEYPVSWGDYDNDGDLDLLITDSFTRIYRNNALVANTVPSAPTSLVAAVAGDSVVLSWNAANDSETPAAGLTYNLRVGTTPGGSEVVAPMAESSGYRKVPQPGNVGHGLFATLKNLPPGTYYWSVQAIDTAFAGSPFASESSFSVWGSFLTIVLRNR